MLFFAICLAVVLQLANTESMPDEKIEPVNLNHFCFMSNSMKQQTAEQQQTCQTAGKEHNKSAIVLLHGMGVSARNWDGVWEVLALRTGRRVCAVDLRNHGDSPWNNRSDVEAMAVDIGHFLDSQNIHKANLIGHSLGGKVASHYALKNAKRVNSIVVEDITVNTLSKENIEAFPFSFHLLQEAIKTVPEGSTEDEAKETIVDYINAKIEELSPDSKIDKLTSKTLEIRCTNGKCQYKWNVDLFEKATRNFEEWWTKSSGLYDGPALFIYGTLSRFDVNGDRKNIMDLFPNAKLVGIEGAGHLLHANFREFNDEVIKLLNKLDD